VPSLPLIAAAIVVTMLAGVAVVAFQERSARGTKRRAMKGANKFVAGLSLGAVGLAGVLEGIGTGAAAGIGELGAVFLSHPSFVVDLGLIGLGTLVVSGKVALSVPVFLFVAFGIVAFGLALDRS
jgi:hypothetical protein